MRKILPFRVLPFLPTDLGTLLGGRSQVESEEIAFQAEGAACVKALR